MTLSVILPASNEEAWIGPCLDALIASEHPGVVAEILVIANGCRDGTVTEAEARIGAGAAAGWRLRVLNLVEGGKLNALNKGDEAAQGALRVYLDADVLVTPPLMRQLAEALTAAPGAAYASGRPRIAPARSALTRAYGRFWQALPFAQSTAPGFGLFAVNAAGRARWGDFPAIISDDTFVRLQFTPEERIEVPASYSWPMVEGFERLVRVRRRQDAGVSEIRRLYPDLLAREGKARLGPAGLLGRALHDPLGFASYALVSLAVRLKGADRDWTRGR